MLNLYYIYAMIMLVLCSLIILLLCGGLAGGVYAYSKANRAVLEANQAIDNFFLADPENGTSSFSQVVGQVAEIQAQRLGVTVQAAIRGSLGGQMQAIVPALEGEAIEANPELAILEMLPKSLKKSQIAQAGLQLLIQKIMAKGGGSGVGDNGSGSGSGSQQAKFSL